MTLEAVYGRVYDSIVSESLQNIIIKYLYRQLGRDILKNYLATM